MKFDLFFERVCDALCIQNVRALAESLEISPSSVYSARRRDSVPPRWILKLSQQHRINIDWLMTGVGEMRLNPEASFESVPKVQARLSAGGGSLEVEEQVVDEIPFRLDWLKKKGVPAKMVMFDVQGDSMEPLIHHGDTVLVDQSRRDIASGKIYAVGVEDAILVKRVVREGDCLTLVSENTNYAPEVFSAESAGDLRIIGKMIWSSREHL